MKVKYTGPARDHSGYGEANRHDIAALHTVGVEVTTQIPSYVMDTADFGRCGAIASKLEDRLIGYQIKILHTTPDQYAKYIEPGKYHIGRVFWETDKLPKQFADSCKIVDEIWTGSEFNKQAIINAGVKDTPIYIIPEAIDTEVPDYPDYRIDSNVDFMFYSIFEWTERKNPYALLEAFYREFEGDEKVGLMLKTYVDNFSLEKKQEIRVNIGRFKRKLGLSNYPETRLFLDLMDKHQIYRFHKSGDCFVSAHRGEGWGIPQMEAMLMGKPIISTNLGGIHEYLTDQVDALLVGYEMVPLIQNSRNPQWYATDQHWGQINIDDLRKKMRYAYSNRKELAKIGKAGQQTVQTKFSLEAVGALMHKRLREINETLGGVSE